MELKGKPLVIIIEEQKDIFLILLKQFTTGVKIWLYVLTVK
jgi:hypothetical protein